MLLIPPIPFSPADAVEEGFFGVLGVAIQSLLVPPMRNGVESTLSRQPAAAAKLKSRAMPIVTTHPLPRAALSWLLASFRTRPSPRPQRRRPPGLHCECKSTAPRRLDADFDACAVSDVAPATPPFATSASTSVATARVIFAHPYKHPNTPPKRQKAK